MKIRGPYSPCPSPKPKKSEWPPSFFQDWRVGVPTLLLLSFQEPLKAFAAFSGCPAAGLTDARAPAVRGPLVGELLDVGQPPPVVPRRPRRRRRVGGEAARRE